MKSLTIFLLLSGIIYAEPLLVNDAELLKTFGKNVGGLTDQDYPSGDDLKESLSDVPKVIECPDTLVRESSEDLNNSVFMIGSVYKCGKCDRWHNGGVATAWVLTKDGLMVTNHHVFEKAKGSLMGVMDFKGNAYAVTEIIAADEPSDLAVFRVDATDLVPLALGQPAEVGDRVHVISHPHKRFYTHTFGDVSRYFLTPAKKGVKSAARMSITADFARGSSGGPVMDENGHVVGMVSSTQVIVQKPNGDEGQSMQQMVMKDCVPVSAILKAIGLQEDPHK